MSETTPVRVTILPTKIWVEDDVWGGRSVMLQHEGCEPFAYCTFHYDWRYTSNASTYDAAHSMARAIGGEEPIEHTHRGLPVFRWYHRALAWAWMRWHELRKAA